ncbi:5-formyltetrahydrofolate cyclo-ligase [Stappia sp. GBMRC 2046]|uniref:5-formyltetrahydrofolate cyclo-ligase n=1 Tax=Stappia sediminis TaxID=2692190 RepID=A0A7X3S819_9HYPH|nr:5-formyltetrahydrofolate cyclo-ligase [Stappia sediminis]MXN65386.1 5-formyltetrahydrofolate cyclo-ligase [Stappia sediminis]
MTALSEIRSKKAELRRAALARRGTLSAEERIEASLDLAGRIGGLDIPPGTAVSAFWPIRDEIDPRPAMQILADRGHALCLPAIVDGELVFRRLDSETQLVQAGFGTVEPGPSAPVLSPEVMLVPLAAFDRRGHRIGYGKGYYDRAIAKLRRSGDPICIGIAFSIQEVEEVPFEDHDEPLRSIVTEGAVIHCPE